MVGYLSYSTFQGFDRNYEQDMVRIADDAGPVKSIVSYLIHTYQSMSFALAIPYSYHELEG